MIKFERKFLQLICLAMKQRIIETCGLGTYQKEGIDYIISDFKWAEYTGSDHPLMDGNELSTQSSTYTDPTILHMYNKKRPANVQWHSHSTFGVFWSGTDERNVKQWIGTELVSIVTNNNLDILIRHDKAFLRGIETQTLYKGNIREIPEEMKFGDKLTKAERKEFLDSCPQRKNTTDNWVYSKDTFRRLRLSEQEGSVPRLPYL